MGDITVVAFGGLALAGLALVGLGALRGARVPVVVGSGLLLALAGLWTLGLYGALVGVIALAFVKRSRAGSR